MKSLPLLALCIVVSTASPALAMGPAAGTRGDDSGTTAAPPAKADPSLPVKSESISGPTNPVPPVAPDQQPTKPCTTAAKPDERPC